jgi:hypothetical protein
VDIFTQGDPIALLGGSWYGLEGAAADPFRWVADSATMHVAQLTRAPYDLVIEAEPGPAVDNKPFDLALIEGGAVVSSLRLEGRQALRFDLASGDPRVRVFTLKCRNVAGAAVVPGDTREMKFRVFRISLERRGSDVVSQVNGLKVAQGWYPLETFGGEIFRWAGPEAIIEAQPGAHVDAVVLDIEPGPGVGVGPLKLKVFAGSTAAGEIVVATRERVEIPWPKSNGAALRLRVDGGGKMIATDPRVMNFRAFARPD